MTHELHKGDCLKVLQRLKDKSIDLVLTDPSYGINLINGGGRGIDGWRDFKDDGDWDKKRPDKVYFDEMLRVGKAVIIWGGNYFTDYLPPSQQWLIWDKGQRDFSLADAELAWSSQDKAARIFTHPRSRMLKENGLHPTQKPIALMEWCILEIVKECKTVLDPFMGSGTTGVACTRTGKDFIGCEIKPKYFAIAKKRIQQETQAPLMV